MAGQLKEVRSRIKSTQSTQQITKAMKMVSAAKLRRAQDSIIKMRPYSKKLQHILSNIINNDNNMQSIPFLAKRPIVNVLMIVITSDRGLCGGYNANLIKLAKSTILQKYPTQKITIWNVGKKGYESLTKMGYTTDASYKDIFLNLTYNHVKELAEKATDTFLSKKFDAIEIVYSEFKNAASQYFVVEPFLPIQFNPQKSESKNDFIFEPEKETLLLNLIPTLLSAQIFKAILDAQASEHGARMTAMDKASENAAELLKSLKISYNRARQASITTELTEIVSGAAALNG